MSLAVGPLGRNGEASGALSTKGKVAAMFVHYITLISNALLPSFQVQLLEDLQPFWWCLGRGHDCRARGCELTCVSQNISSKPYLSDASVGSSPCMLVLWAIALLNAMLFS